MGIQEFLDDPATKTKVEQVRQQAIHRLTMAKHARDMAQREVNDADKAVGRLDKLLAAIDYYEIPL